MSLSCECGEYDGDGWYYNGNSGYITLQTKRRKRCVSCKEMIEIGSVCIQNHRVRPPTYDSIEEKIYGEDSEIPMADHYHCERCSDLYLSLEELGYCVSPLEDMRELVKEYAEMKKMEADHKKKMTA